MQCAYIWELSHTTNCYLLLHDTVRYFDLVGFVQMKCCIVFLVVLT